jgi:hypothetical protein
MNGTRAERERELRRFLSLLARGAPFGTLLDVRWRLPRGEGMAQEFHPLGASTSVERLLRLSERADVYVGAAPRTRRAGGRDALGACRLLWADCDSEAAVAALADVPAPTMLVASGSAGHNHAYWSVGPALSPAEVEEANRRLAQGLGADAGAVCGPAAILRPPGSFNRKRSPPVPVRLHSFEPERCYPLAALLGRLPALEASQTESSTTSARERPADPLLAISARLYIPALSGRAVSPTGKVLCPFHDDQTPSLHAYREPERGWCCFGCRSAGGRPRGGDIYSFASLLFGIPASGAGFLRLRGRLDERFGVRR